MGLRKQEWLFLTCLNHLIILRLVKSDDCPCVAYSPMLSIENSSKPFMVLLGAILSVKVGFAVEASTPPYPQLDLIEEGKDPGKDPGLDKDDSDKDDYSDGLGAYHGGIDTNVSHPNTRANAKKGEQGC